MLRRAATALLAVALLAGVGGWWFQRSGQLKPFAPQTAVAKDVSWLDHLYSQNPNVSEEAVRQIRSQGLSAIPRLQEILRDPAALEQNKKAALKACAALGTLAAPAVRDVAAHLSIPVLTAEAAVALSFMGGAAFVPLRDALVSEDPTVRKESLRAIGKLRERASLDAAVVMPLLLDGLADPDPGVRVVAATYLGIIHQDGVEVVPALVEILEDEDAEVRTAAAAALGSFGPEAEIAVPALRKAAGDKDENVAREAAMALVRLNRQP